MTEDVHDLIGAYVVGALTPEERESFERHVATCDACSREVASLAGVVGHLADAEAIAPPASLRAGVMAGIAGVAQVAPTASAASSPAAPAAPVSAAVTPKRTWPRILAAAASILVLAGVGTVGVTAYRERQETVAMEHNVMMVTTAPDAHSMDLALGTSHLVMSESMGAVVAMGQDTPAPSAGMEYQLWLMMPDGSSKAGPTFMPAADGSFTTYFAADMDGATGVAVTEEPMGGSDSMTGEMVAEVQL